MSKGLYMWVVVAVLGVFYSPTPGFAMIFGETDRFDVMKTSNAIDIMPTNVGPDLTTFVVTPEPITMTLFSLGLLGLIKLKNRIN